MNQPFLEENKSELKQIEYKLDREKSDKKYAVILRNSYVAFTIACTSGAIVCDNIVVTGFLGTIGAASFLTTAYLERIHYLTKRNIKTLTKQKTALTKGN